MREAFTNKVTEVLGAVMRSLVAVVLKWLKQPPSL